MYKYSMEKTELAPFVKKAKNITLLILLCMTLMLFLPWEQTTKGEGKLIALDPSERDYPIMAPISGFIKEYNIKENTFVKKGSLLFEMVDLDIKYLDRLKGITKDINSQYINTKNNKTIIGQQIDNLKENLQTGLQIYDSKIAQIHDTLDSLKNKEASHRSHLKITRANYKRIKAMHDEGIESQRNYEVVSNQLIDSENALKNIRLKIKKEEKSLAIQEKEKKRFLKDQENKISHLKSQLLTQQNSIEDFNKEMKQVSINLSRNSTAKVFATKDGFPLRVLKNDKDHYIKQGEKILHFAPKVTQRVVLLKIRALDMPLVKPDLKVRIQFYGWPSLQVSGWPKITYGTFGGIVKSVDSIAHEEGYVYAYIKEDPQDPWPDSKVLKVGTKATAWIRLSTVSIWYELWRLHNALPLKMVNLDEK